jgi:hypothetical protein
MSVRWLLVIVWSHSAANSTECHMKMTAISHMLIAFDGKVKVKCKVVTVLFLNWAPRHEGVLGSVGIAPRIHDLGTRWSWVVSFTPQPLYLQGKSPWYPLDRRLGGPQSRSGRGGDMPVTFAHWNKRDIRLQTAEMRWTAGHSLLDYRRNEYVLEENDVYPVQSKRD